MICPACRGGDHLDCPDFANSRRGCDCQHQERGTALAAVSDRA